MSDDVTDAQACLDEQAEWAATNGYSFRDRAMAKMVSWMGKARDRIVSLEGDRDQAKAAIQDLRTRVKALEDRAP